MILDRMLIRLALRNLGLALLALLALFLLVDMLETAGRLLDRGVAAGPIARYALSKIPGLGLQLLPAALLLGVASAFAQLGRHGELRALGACGLSSWRLLRPLALLGVGCGLAVLALSEWAVPPAARHMEGLMQGELGRVDSSWRFFRTHLWFKLGPGHLVQLGPRQSDGRGMRAVTELELDEDFHLRRRRDMAKVRWREEDRTWTAFQVLEREFAADGGSSYEEHKEKRLGWGVGPERFAQVSGRPSEKNLAQLSATVGALRGRGLDPAEYLLAWHWRWAYPLMGLLLLLIMFPRWSAPQRRTTLAMALFEGALLTSLAFGLQALGRFAVSGASLPAAWGAWGPSLLLALAALVSWGPTLRRSRP